ncbi:MAG: HNH endonuclease [Nostocoides sp.]
MAAPEVAVEFLRREVIAGAVQRRADELGGALPRVELANFPLPDGSALRLIDGGGGGIWNPRDFLATLSIVTSPDGPYEDRESDGGLLHYSYQRGRGAGRNAKLDRARELGLPVLRLHKIADSWYQPIYPVFVIDDNPFERTFVMTLDEALRALPAGRDLSPIEKLYAARTVRQRVHQPAFRARVLLAYGRECTICSLRHVELLDAAHIIEDRDDDGVPVVSNGLSLCKIHHAAYDRQFLGIDPDYKVVVNSALLEEVDGPMLRHGLQEMHGRSLTLPKQRRDHPDRDGLARRFAIFQAG